MIVVLEQYRRAVRYFDWPAAIILASASFLLGCTIGVAIVEWVGK